MGIRRRDAEPRGKGSTMSVPRIAWPLPNPGRDRSLSPTKSANPASAEVEKELGSSPDGLTQAEAQKRLTQYGPNEIAEKKTNQNLKFLSDPGVRSPG